MLTVNLDSDEPLLDQIVRGIRTAIASGQVPAGAELPPVRQLAMDLGVNWNTVSRAYRVLQASGLVHTARGRGTRVTSEVEVNGEARKSVRERLTAQVQSILTDAKLAGLKRSELEKMLTKECEAMWPSR
ncbi:MAG: GntR family transcriptional regulator [Planctomycetes bacterium]|nr:GntR family transcriptional regulator [Planctomycetota bacterium]